ncbi:hypothetical protein M758_6G008400, partial [Ceratodon purpureus]
VETLKCRLCKIEYYCGSSTNVYNALVSASIRNMFSVFNAGLENKRLELFIQCHSKHLLDIHKHILEVLQLTYFLLLPELRGTLSSAYPVSSSFAVFWDCFPQM